MINLPPTDPIQRIFEGLNELALQTQLPPHTLARSLLLRALRVETGLDSEMARLSTPRKQGGD